MANAVRTVISPGRYVQGKGAIHQLGEYLKQIGSTPLIVADDLVWGLVGHDIEASLRAAGPPAHREKFNRIPSAGEVDRLVPILPAQSRPGAGRLPDRRQRAGVAADRGCRRRAGHLARGQGDRQVQLQDDGRWAADRHRHRAGGAELEGALGERAGGDRRGVRPPGHPGGGQGDRGEHAVVRPRVRVRRAGRRARDPQRADRGRRDTRPGARSEGEHRLGHPTGAGGRAVRGHPRLHRIHHPGRVAQHTHRGGLKADDNDSLRIVAEAATVPGETIHSMPFQVTAADVVSALTTIERLPRGVRERAGLPAPKPYVAHH